MCFINKIIKEEKTMKKLTKVHNRKNTVESFKTCGCLCTCYCATTPSATLSRQGSAVGSVVLYNR